MSLFEESVKNANAAIECWAKVIDFLQVAEGPNGEKFNQEAEVPGTEQELWWFDERVIAVCNLIKSLKKIELNSGAPVPLAYVDQFEQASQLFKDIILEATNSVELVKERGVADLNPSSWEVADETSDTFNFASHLQNIKSHVEALLMSFYQIGPIVGAGKFDAFTEAVRELSEKMESARKSANEVSKAKENAKGNASATNTQKAKAEKSLSRISSVSKAARETLVKIEEINQSSQSEFEQVSEISSKANSLKSQVDGYETQFLAFQQSLDDRNTEFKKWGEDVKVFYSEMKEKDEQVGEVIQRAEEMLKGATNAGLASTFNTTLSDLDRKLKQAQRAFYVSIFLLFLSALPLALYLVVVAIGFFDPQAVEASGAAKGIWGNLAPTFNGNNLSISTTIALSLFVIPTIWLTKFSAARHHQFFQLKEDYQYKYSLAMAVDGFKKQAPEYADAIAAETFNRLLFNPADRLEGKGASDEHPNPLMNSLMNKIGFNAKGQGQ